MGYRVKSFLRHSAVKALLVVLILVVGGMLVVVAERSPSPTNREHIAAASVVPHRALLTQAIKKTSGPHIDSVTIRGNESHPLIVVAGYDFGSEPNPDPTNAPQNYYGYGCSLPNQASTAQVFGLNYGNDLYFKDFSASPAWSAGRYRLSEMDCIGLILKRFTSTSVVFALGGAYPHYPGVQRRYLLRSGNHFVLEINGAVYSGRVRYQ